jgi:hypothetical protein
VAKTALVPAAASTDGVGPPVCRPPFPQPTERPRNNSFGLTPAQVLDVVPAAAQKALGEEHPATAQAYNKWLTLRISCRAGWLDFIPRNAVLLARSTASVR